MARLEGRGTLCPVGIAGGFPLVRGALRAYIGGSSYRLRFVLGMSDGSIDLFIGGASSFTNWT